MLLKESARRIWTAYGPTRPGFVTDSVGVEWKITTGQLYKGQSLVLVGRRSWSAVCFGLMHFRRKGALDIAGCSQSSTPPQEPAASTSSLHCLRLEMEHCT